ELRVQAKAAAKAQEAVSRPEQIPARALCGQALRAVPAVRARGRLGRAARDHAYPLGCCVELRLLRGLQYPGRAYELAQVLAQSGRRGDTSAEQTAKQEQGLSGARGRAGARLLVRVLL